MNAGLVVTWQTYSPGVSVGNRDLSRKLPRWIKDLLATAKDCGLGSVLHHKKNAEATKERPR
jgi:hypothetical protein